MRVLGAVRQSKTRDRSISAPAQRESIQTWADAHGHQVAKLTTDLSTSGSISAFKRAELGPWLSDPARIEQWDILVTTKLDRACRDARDYLRLRDWCRDHGKAYVSIAENLDDTNPAARAMGTVVAAFAEFERERASERALERNDALRTAGRWPGGRLAFGYRAERREDGSYVVPDDGGTAEVARRMAADAIGGISNAAVSRWLNAEGIPTMIGREWRPATVRSVLLAKSTAMLLSEEDQAMLRAAMRARRSVRGQWTSGRHMLLRVAFCSECGKPLYAAKNARKPGGGYYRCLNHPVSAQIAKLEEGVEAELRARWRNRPYQIRQIVPGDSHAKDIARLERQFDSVRDVEFIDTVPLEAEIARLKALPHEADREVLVDTGESMDEHWLSLASPAERGQFLRDNRVAVFVARGGFFTVEATWWAEWNVARKR